MVVKLSFIFPFWGKFFRCFGPIREPVNTHTHTLVFVTLWDNLTGTYILGATLSRHVVFLGKGTRIRIAFNSLYLVKV